MFSNCHNSRKYLTKNASKKKEKKYSAQYSEQTASPSFITETETKRNDQRNEMFLGRRSRVSSRGPGHFSRVFVPRAPNRNHNFNETARRASKIMVNISCSYYFPPAVGAQGFTRSEWKQKINDSSERGWTVREEGMGRGWWKFFLVF